MKKIVTTLMFGIALFAFTNVSAQESSTYNIDSEIKQLTEKLDLQDSQQERFKYLMEYYNAMIEKEEVDKEELNEKIVTQSRGFLNDEQYKKFKKMKGVKE